MGDSLSYRISETGELGFNEIVETARDWIKGNVNGQLKLTASISLKVTAVKDGESVQDIGATAPLGLKTRAAVERLREANGGELPRLVPVCEACNGTGENARGLPCLDCKEPDASPVIDARGAKPGEVLHMSSACAHRHHTRCKDAECRCGCEHPVTTENFR